MYIAAVLAIILSMPTPTQQSSKLTGVWILERGKSDLGVVTPDRLILRVEQADQGYAVWEITVTPEGRSLAYRHLSLGATPCNADFSDAVRMDSCWIDSGSGGDQERWRLTVTGDLVIARTARIGEHRIRQRLVLAASREVLE